MRACASPGSCNFLGDLINTFSTGIVHNVYNKIGCCLYTIKTKTTKGGKTKDEKLVVVGLVAGNLLDIDLMYSSSLALVQSHLFVCLAVIYIPINNRSKHWGPNQA